MGSFTQSWNDQKNRRVNLLSQRVDLWSKKPQLFEKDLTNKDFDVLNWETLYQNMPLWVYLFFSDHGPFKIKNRLKPQNDFALLFLKFCQTRHTHKASLPPPLSYTPWEIAQEGAGAYSYPLSHNMAQAALCWSQQEDTYSGLKALMDVCDTLAQKHTTQFQGVVAHGLKQAMLDENFPHDLASWWKNQHSSPYYSFTHKAIVSLPEALFGGNFLSPQGEINEKSADIIEELMARRFEKYPKAPSLILPSSLKMIEWFRKNNPNPTYRAFLEKVLLMDATQTWPFQQRTQSHAHKKM